MCDSCHLLVTNSSRNMRRRRNPITWNWTFWYCYFIMRRILFSLWTQHIPANIFGKRCNINTYTHVNEGVSNWWLRSFAAICNRMREDPKSTVIISIDITVPTLQNHLNLQRHKELRVPKHRCSSWPLSPALLVVNPRVIAILLIQIFKMKKINGLQN